MSRFHSYLQSASTIITQYKGDVPFAIYVKQYFKAYKKYGSRDRKFITALCYQYFRVCHAVSGDVKDKIILGEFLCKSESEFLREVAPVLHDKVGLSSDEKLRQQSIDPSKLFPFQQFLTSSIDIEQYALSMLQQPDVFLRLRKRGGAVEQKLRAAGVEFEKANDEVLRLKPGVDVQEVISLDKEAVIQDLQSAKVFDELQDLTGEKRNLDVWDCCAASGGKSILLADKVSAKIHLTVTDVRKTILHNLQLRLAKAKIPVQRMEMADLTAPIKLSGAYDLIICDAPCSGSGTWSRTPEQMLFFNDEMLESYVTRQKKIVENVMPFLKHGGLFYYITCSVFEKENEEVVDYIKQRFPLELHSTKYLTGYETRSDSMFYAVFRLP